MTRGALALAVLAACGGAPKPAAVAPAAPASAAAAPSPAAAPSAAAPDWLAPVDLQGPYRDLEALCADANAADGATGACEPRGAAHPVPGGAAQLELVATGGDAEAPDCVLALHAASGWFASDTHDSCGGIKQGGELSITAVTDQRVGPGARSVVLVALHGMSRNENQTDDGKTYDLTDEQTGFIACDATQAPRCTPLVVTATTQRGELSDTGGEVFPPATWTFDVRWPGDGTLVVTARAAATPDSPDVTAPATQAGTYRIALP